MTTNNIDHNMKNRYCRDDSFIIWRQEPIIRAYPINQVTLQFGDRVGWKIQLQSFTDLLGTASKDEPLNIKTAVVPPNNNNYRKRTVASVPSSVCIDPDHDTSMDCDLSTSIGAATHSYFVDGTKMPHNKTTAAFSKVEYIIPNHQQFMTDDTPSHNDRSPPSSSSPNIPSLSTSPSSVISTITCAPKQLLNTYYGQLPSRISITNAHYQTWKSNGKPHDLWYISIFTCPLSKEIFVSGRYGNDGTIYKIDAYGCAWFKRKILAEHGAAARAFDCLNDRRNRRERAGLETPYKKGYRMTLPPIILNTPSLQGYNFVGCVTSSPPPPTTTTTSSPAEAIPACPSQDNDVPMTATTTSTSMTSTEPITQRNAPIATAIQTTPKNELFAYYFALASQKGKPMPCLNKYYFTRETKHQNNNMPLYTSIFICPWTSERFPSGRLGSTVLECTNCYFAIKDSKNNDINDGEAESSVEAIWYTQKDTAEQAAAARALDCMHYRNENME